MDEEGNALEKGSDEWKAACGEKNFGNDHAVKHGKYVKKPFMCSKECKVFDSCPYADSCQGNECIEIIKETEIIEDIIQKKKELLTKRIKINEVRLEIADRLSRKSGYVDFPELHTMEVNLMEMIDRLKKEINEEELKHERKK